MNTETYFTFQDVEEFTAVIGANDRNLPVMERLLDTELFPRGTELHLSSSGDVSAEKDAQFNSLMSELVQYRRNGQEITREVIEALWVNLTEDVSRVQELREQSIFIPQGYSKVFPRSFNQSKFLHALNTTDLVFGIGPAGTGKTYLAVAHALSEILSRKKKKLILTRPVVEAGENLGFLPGDLSQKLNPYLKPLYDAMDSLVPTEIITRLEANRVIEIAPLAYMRGRSLRDAYIILDEAQNTTAEQMKMFLTRLGEGSRAVITGDITQIDLPRHNNSGLIHATRILKKVEGIHFSYFTSRDVVRSALVRRIIAAYEREQNS